MNCDKVQWFSAKQLSISASICLNRWFLGFEIHDWGEGFDFCIGPIKIECELINIT